MDPDLGGGWHYVDLYSLTICRVGHKSHRGQVKNYWLKPVTDLPLRLALISSKE